RRGETTSRLPRHRRGEFLEDARAMTVQWAWIASCSTCRTACPCHREAPKESTVDHHSLELNRVMRAIHRSSRNFRQSGDLTAIDSPGERNSIRWTREAWINASRGGGTSSHEKVDRRGRHGLRARRLVGALLGRACHRRRNRELRRQRPPKDSRRRRKRRKR